MSPHKLLLDYVGAADVLSLSPAALRNLVSRRKGPQIVKLGRRTLFAVDDLKAWVEAHKQPGSSDQSWLLSAPRSANLNELLPVKNMGGRPIGSKNRPKAEAA